MRLLLPLPSRGIEWRTTATGTSHAIDGTLALRLALLIVLGNRRRREITDRRKIATVIWSAYVCFARHHGTSVVAHLQHGILFGDLTRSFGSLGLRRGLRQELLEVLQQIWRVVEQARNLSIHILDGFRLSLVCLQYFQELFIDVWVLGEAVLKEYISVLTIEWC